MANLCLQYDSENELNVNVVDCTIHDKLNLKQIEEFRTIFVKNNKEMQYDKLREALELFDIKMSNIQYKSLYLKMNMDRAELIDWNEFISYLIYCFKQDDAQNQQDSIVLPISMEPISKKGCHKTPIIGITLMESSVVDDEEAFGSYLTVSKDGYINIWSSDLEVNRSGTSKSHYLKYTPTWVLGIIALSDIQIICVSSTERELRFYDVMATNFLLRLIIRSVPCAICKMNYFCTTLNNNCVNSKLLLGDMNGNVYIIEFSPILRGPFQSKPGSMLMEFTWHELSQNKLPSIIVKEYKHLFMQFITDVLYSFKFDTLFISAEGSLHSGGVLAIYGRQFRNHFYMPQGVSTIALSENDRILATGGPDTYLRFWDPFLPGKASAVLTGHHAGVIYIFIQSEERKCYSIDKAKIIKVWHLFNLTLLQTYSDLNTIIPNETALCYMYNKVGHELLVGGRNLISIKCCLKMKLDLTDGYTHTAAISVVLYNHLYENIVTCGLDSYIIVWDYWTGRRQIIMKGCHTKESMGETINLEITAATFDPARQYLLTGARDGSLKIWNYNHAACIRNMNIEVGCEVAAVIWIVDRIFAVGWNRRVTEFADTIDGKCVDSKQWLKIHEDDVTAAAYKIGETFVTGSSGGELVLWKIGTGQPYRKYDVKNPTEYIPLLIDTKVVPQRKSRIRIAKDQKNVNAKLNIKDLSHHFHSVSNILIGGNKPKKHQRQISLSREVSKTTEQLVKTIRKKTIRRLDSRGIVMPALTYEEPPSPDFQIQLGILAILFLKSRPQSKDHGSIVVSLDNGNIQFYSHHQGGGFIDQFYAIHKSGDNILSLGTDKSNKYLFTGTAVGYIKVWLLQNYCIPKSEHTHICKPLLRLQFSFLMNERILGRAKRVARNKEPMLLNSYKAHLSGITSIIYIEHSKIVVSGSNDYSVRMWTLSGRYIGTIGGHVPMLQLIRTKPVEDIYKDIDEKKFRIPPDIDKVASSTTIRVLSGQQPNIFNEFIKQSTAQANMDKTTDKELDIIDVKHIPSFGSTVHRCSMKQKMYTLTKLKEPSLGKQMTFTKCCLNKNLPVLDKNLPHIPVYTHLNVYDTKTIKHSRASAEIKQINKFNFMGYYKSKNKKNI